MTIRNLQSAIRNRSNEGFTLIEILLAIGILAIGITAVLSLFAVGARSHSRAINRTRSALLAEAVIHQVQADLAAPELPACYKVDGVNLGLVDAGGQPLVNLTRKDFPGFYYNVTFTPYEAGTDYYRVSVEVRWGAESAPADSRNSETYETILPRKRSL